MKVNNLQKVVAVSGILLVLAICLYPPRYYETNGVHGKRIVSAWDIKHGRVSEGRAYPLIEHQRYLLILGVLLVCGTLIFMFSQTNMKLPNTILSRCFLLERMQAAYRSKKISKVLLLAVMLIVGSITLAFMREFHLNGFIPIVIVFTPFLWLFLKILDGKTINGSDKEALEERPHPVNHFQMGLDYLKRSDRSKAMEQAYILRANKKDEEARQLETLIMKSANKSVIKLVVVVAIFGIIYFVLWFLYQAGLILQ